MFRLVEFQLRGGRVLTISWRAPSVSTNIQVKHEEPCGYLAMFSDSFYGPRTYALELTPKGIAAAKKSETERLKMAREKQENKRVWKKLRSRTIASGGGPKILVGTR